jgi:hypothetical protein
MGHYEYLDLPINIPRFPQYCQQETEACAAPGPGMGLTNPGLALDTLQYTAMGIKKAA